MIGDGLLSYPLQIGTFVRHAAARLPFALVVLLGTAVYGSSASAWGGGNHRHGGGGGSFGIPAVGGPEQLRNKTIVLSWQEYRGNWSASPGQ